MAVAPSNPQRVYALIETGQRGSLWRSDDGGEKWKLVNNSRLLNERPHYYTRMLVMPDNANEVYFPSNGMGVTYDGGETSEQVRWGGDNHDMWADPKDPRRMMIGNDGGVFISSTRGREWSFTRLPIGQMYHVATDNRIPYWIYGQMQDDGSMRGPSCSREDRESPPRSGPRPPDARPVGRRPTPSIPMSSGEAATPASSRGSTRGRACPAPSASGPSARWAPTRGRSSSA